MEEGPIDENDEDDGEIFEDMEVENEESDKSSGLDDSLAESDDEECDSENNEDSESDEISEDEEQEIGMKKKAKGVSIARLKLGKLNIQDVPNKLQKLCTGDEKCEKPNEYGLQCEIIEDECDLRNKIKLIVYGATLIKKTVPEGDDVNRGKVWFYYWEADGEVKVYAVMRSGRSNLWVKLLGQRDTNFPKTFAMTFLDPKSIKHVSGLYLTGLSAGKFTKRYSKSDSFCGAEIMHNYGVIETLDAQINAVKEEGKQLKKYLRKDLLIKVKFGQVKFTISDFDYFGLLLFIDQKVSEFRSDNVSDKWEFLRYVQMPASGEKTRLKKNLVHEIDAVYLNQLETSDAFEVDNFLVHQHQDAFDNCGKVELKHGKTQIPWLHDKDEIYRRGEEILIKDVFKALEVYRKKKVFKSLKNLTLYFYDPISSKTEKTPFHHFFITQTYLNSAGKNKACFQYGKLWFIVELDTLMDTTIRFVNIIKSSLITEERDGDYPEMLPWCTEKTGLKPHFHINELLKFVGSQNGNLDEIALRVTKVLTKKRSLFTHAEDKLTHNNCAVESDLTEDNEHSGHLLAVNMLALGETEHGKYFFGSKGKKLSSRVDEFQRLVAECKTLDEVKQKFSYAQEKKKEELSNQMELSENEKEKRPKKSKTTSEKNWAGLEKVLEKKFQCLVKEKDGDFTVESPYITKKTLAEVLQLKICPIRLVQFLRMYIPKDEGEYNELYHLSNCKCQSSSWQYVAGDRILDQSNQYIELFDVMAFCQRKKEAYLFHVKNGFDANALRAASSQVRICGDEIWKSISANPVNDTFQKYFTVASKAEDETSSLHRRLIKKEIETISDSKEEFSSMMCDSKMTFNICLSPCLEKKNLSNIANCNLMETFKREDFSQKNTLERLWKLGIIHKSKNRLMSSFFGSQKAVLELMQDGFSKAEAKRVYDTIKTKTRISDDIIKGSFIAKVAVIDVHRIFSDFFLGSGQTRVMLKIWQVKSIESKKQKGKRQTYIPFKKIDK